MKLLKKVLNKLNGLYYSQEYLCLSSGSFQQPLYLYLVDNGLVIKDITKLHCFVGYCPLVFAFPSNFVDNNIENIELVFSERILTNNDILNPKDALAWLYLKKIAGLTSHDGINFFEGAEGRHRFVSGFHKMIIQLNNRLYQNRTGNVFLPGNLLQQVQIAYSLPREICLISVGQDGHFNLFPTDLHGQVDEDLYLISLRHQGKACHQVMTTQKIVLSRVENSFYKTVYGLGKNHMQELRSKDTFPFSNELSQNFHLPLPGSAIYYRELEFMDSFIYGIHRVMLFKTRYQQELQPGVGGLAHVHNIYATWRHKQGLPGNYLLR